MKVTEKYKTSLRYILSFMTGSIVLISCSMIQKGIILRDWELTRNPITYIVPMIFGGLVGIVVSYFIRKITTLNKKLQNRVSNLEKIIPICSVCKKICVNPEERQEERKWIEAEEYLLSQKLSHSYCTECYQMQLETLEKSPIKKK